MCGRTTPLRNVPLELRHIGSSDLYPRAVEVTRSTAGELIVCTHDALLARLCNLFAKAGSDEYLDCCVGESVSSI